MPPVYGINTGFGALAETAIPRDALGRAAAATCCAATRPASASRCPSARVRAMMALRANVLAKGFSGIRRETLDALIDAAQRARPPGRAEPRLGRRERRPRAAGAPGAGARRRGRRRRVGDDPPAIAGRRRRCAGAGLAPVTLAAEGRAGADQRHAGVHGGRGAGAARRASGWRARPTSRPRCRSTRCAARCIPFEARIHDARPHAGPARLAPPTSARCSSGAPINASHENCGRVQDAYSLRCAPQVHGAARDALGFTRARRSTSRPTPRPTTRWSSPTTRARSCRAATSTARRSRIAADLIAIGLAQLATISERRSDRLVNPALSGLPAFLTRDSGLHSGYMMAQVTAAALASELKTLAHPGERRHDPDVGQPRRSRQHEHGRGAQGRARAVELATRVIAIEILCACQAIDLLAPLATSPPLRRVHARVRSMVPTLTDDRPPSPDIEAISRADRRRLAGTRVRDEVK